MVFYLLVISYTQAGAPIRSELEAQKVMAALIFLAGEAPVGRASPEVITIGQILGGMKQWRRQNVLNVATPTSNTVTAGDGVSDIAKVQGTATPGALPVTARHGAARASPNASGALFVQLEDLTAECVAKDSDIRRLKRQSKGLEKELKETAAALADAHAEQQARHPSQGGEMQELSTASTDQRASTAAELTIANTRAEESEAMARGVLDSCAQSVERAETELDGYLIFAGA